MTNNQQAVASPHDYEPYGVDITVLAGGRTNALGYEVSDYRRQKFTSKERDTESNLDLFGQDTTAQQRG
ncbi:MAG TPA: hypothetical protein VI756_31975 [Blastocatellia bacterium]